MRLELNVMVHHKVPILKFMKSHIAFYNTFLIHTVEYGISQLLGSTLTDLEAN